MILYPSPFLGWNVNYKGAINYAAMARFFVSGGPTVITDLQYRVSGDGVRWYKAPLTGDIAEATRSTHPTFGAFYPTKMIRFGNRLIVVGRFWDDPNNSRGAIFWTDDSVKWHHAPTSIDGIKSVAGTRNFVDVVVFGSLVVALLNTGERAVSADGETWAGYGNIGFSGAADALAAGTGVIVSSGAGGQAYTASDATGAFTLRNAQAGSTRIYFAEAGNVLLLAGTNYLATSPLNSGTTWTLRSDPVSGSFDWIGYGGGRWFASGSADKWIASAAGDAWTAPSTKPNTGARVWSGFHDATKWLLFMTAGKLAVSDDDGTSWNVHADSGLADADYIATSMAA